MLHSGYIWFELSPFVACNVLYHSLFRLANIPDSFPAFAGAKGIYQQLIADCEGNCVFGRFLSGHCVAKKHFYDNAVTRPSAPLDQSVGVLSDGRRVVASPCNAA